MPFLDFLHRAAARSSLTMDEARAAMTAILEGHASTPQIAAFLVALKMKGETVDEIAGFAQAMRTHSARVDSGVPSVRLLDTCGTGGDGLNTFNISTVTALVVAGAGVAVAKHGNRSLASHCGSADILEALGVNIALPPAAMAASIRQVGIGFLFAPALHPAMKHAQPARAELKMRTAFNLLGPLTNPAGAANQLIGAPSEWAAELMAHALARLGTHHAFVVHASDGLDEITLSGPTLAWEVQGERVSACVFTPDDFRLPRISLDGIRAHSKAENLAMAQAVLDGQPGPPRNIVLANAAVALFVVGRASGIQEGVALAAESIDSGAARAKLEELVRFSQSQA